MGWKGLCKHTTSIRKHKQRISTENKLLLVSELLTLLGIPLFKEPASLFLTFLFIWHGLWLLDPFKLKENEEGVGV